MSNGVIYPLTIAHRVCPHLASTAVVYESKFDMVKATTQSLARALQKFAQPVKLVVVLDGCSSDYVDLFNETFSDNKEISLTIEETPSIGNFATYARQVEILKAATTSEYLYFSEDDYLYHPDAFLAMTDILKREDVDFVTPLDHPDRYNHANGNVRGPKMASLLITRYGHWRTADTSCLTFMTTRKIFNETVDILASYGKGAMDGTMWLGITKEEVFKLGALLSAIFAFIFRLERPFIFYMPLCAWKHHGLRLLTMRRYSLWQPIPSMAVHLSNMSLPFNAERFLSFLSNEQIEELKKIEYNYLEIS